MLQSILRTRKFGVPHRGFAHSKSRGFHSMAENVLLRDKLKALNQEQFIQLPRTSTCGIVAPLQMHNWVQPTHKSYFLRERAIALAKKFYFTEENLDPKESMAMIVKIAEDSRSLVSLRNLMVGSNPFKLKMSDLKEVNGEIQFLASYDRHAIAIHEVYMEEGMAVVSGLPDGEGGYHGPMLISIPQLFGQASIPLPKLGRAHKLPEILVTGVAGL